MRFFVFILFFLLGVLTLSEFQSSEIFAQESSPNIKVLSMSYFPVKDCYVLQDRLDLGNAYFKDNNNIIYTGPIDGDVSEGKWGVYSDLDKAGFELGNINLNISGIRLYFFGIDRPESFKITLYDTLGGMIYEEIEDNGLDGYQQLSNGSPIMYKDYIFS